MLGSYFENYSLEQLNKVPQGFNNSLFWNMAHIVVTQQLLVYKLSGLPMAVSDELIKKYSKGTKPEQDASQDEVDYVRSLLFSTVDQLEADYNKGLFVNFQQYPTSTGLVLDSAERAIAFNNFHEGLHLGVLMSLRKLV